MDNPLDRVMTFSRNTMAAASLPLELQQEIFSYLDGQSFCAARKVCRWWRMAGLDTVTLSRQLQKLPIKPTVHPRETEPQELQRLFNEAARTLLLGVRVIERTEDEGSLSLKSNAGLLARPRIAAVARGNKTATIQNGWLALFDTAQDPPEVLYQRRLGYTIEAAQQVSWLKIAPAASCALALSSGGGLLALAQERTIEIYDLTGGPEGQTVSRTIASPAGHYIKGLDFELNDRVLRVQLSGKGVVLYLGTPSLSEEASEPACMEHWTSKAGLRHTLLDSSLLQLSSVAAGAEQYQSRLGGLQLLRPHHDGLVFAAQKHGGNESSHYIYAHIRCSQPTDSLPLAVEPNSVTELAKLETFLSAWDYHRADSGMGSWECMPSAHEHQPKFAMSEDGTLLLLAEREKKRVRHVTWTQLFLYRLPAPGRVGEMVREGEEKAQIRWKRLARFLDGERDDGEVEEVGKGRPVVGRIPLSIGSMEGATMEIDFRKSGDIDGLDYGLEVVTTATRRAWELVET